MSHFILILQINKLTRIHNNVSVFVEWLVKLSDKLLFNSETRRQFKFETVT